jgi:O-antigen ligase
MHDLERWRLGAMFVAGALAIYFVVSHSSYFIDPAFLGLLVFLELLLAVLLNYRAAFFPALIVVFLLAGTAVPAHDVWTSARWVVLGAGAIVGLAMWLNHYRLRVVHLIALACVLTAVVSALVSTYPDVALLKALSLMLLFLYAAAGVRVAVTGREEQFFATLLLGCEILVYVSAVAYLGFRLELFGNRNSLGVVMGVVAFPFLLWSVLVSNRRSQRRRRVLALLLCQILLLISYERAGIVAALVSFTLLCVGLRRYRVFFAGLALALIAAPIAMAIVPLPAEIQPDDGSLTSRFVYKGKREAGVLASRKSVWEKAISSLQQHPWLGTGFGTSATGYDKTQIAEKFASAGQVTREHGNSYLEIAEWVGLIGVAPFTVLLCMLAGNVIRVFVWMRSTGIARSPAVPLAVFVAGALVHAGFEDWLFAVGYHTSVLFWILAFLLCDFVPRKPVTAGQIAAENVAALVDRAFVAVTPAPCTYS